MRRRQTFFILGSVSALLLSFSLLGLWDLARKQATETKGVYDLPFMIATVPWYVAGDFLVLMGVASFVIVLWYLYREAKRR